MTSLGGRPAGCESLRSPGRCVCAWRSPVRWPSCYPCGPAPSALAPQPSRAHGPLGVQQSRTVATVPRAGMHHRAPGVPVQPARGPRYRAERRPTRVASPSQGNRPLCTPSIPAAPAGRAASARPARHAENEPGREAGGKAMSRRAILTGPSSRLARARPTAQRLSSRSAPQRGLRRSRLPGESDQ